MAGFEVGSVGPLMELGDPEGVFGSRNERLIITSGVAVSPDGDLDEVLAAGADDGGGDGFLRRFAGCGSVAVTVSPMPTFSMGLVVPSAIRTAVPGTKLLTRQLSRRRAFRDSRIQVLTPLARSPASFRIRLTRSAAFFHFVGRPYFFQGFAGDAADEAHGNVECGFCAGA